MKILQRITYILLSFLCLSCIQKSDDKYINSSGSSYLQSGGSVNYTNKVYSASLTNESGIAVSNSGNLTLTSSRVITTGNTSSQINSFFYGLNAAVLASSGSTINLSDCSIKTSGTGAIGAYSLGPGSSIILSTDSIITTNAGANGVDASAGGTLSLSDVFIMTSGAHAAAISADWGGGVLNVSNSTAITYGSNSPGIYSAGNINVANSSFSALGAEGAVIEGSSYLQLLNSNLSGSKGIQDYGVLIYLSNLGAVNGNTGILSVNGGSITWTSTTGALFYITNCTGIINLNDVLINNSSSILILASADQWGAAGSNGGNVVLYANNQVLIGNILADSSSTVKATLQNTSLLIGSINSGNTARSVNIFLNDSSSRWSVTADSYLSALSDSTGISGSTITNIAGNGFNVYYDTTFIINHPLGRNTFSLVNGGFLIPR
jgi:hypothetical protein